MSYTQLSSKEVTGRKQHFCSWCGESILIGEIHQTRAGIFEGEFQHSREHLECLKAMGQVDHEEMLEGYMPGEFLRGSTERR